MNQNQKSDYSSPVSNTSSDLSWLKGQENKTCYRAIFTPLFVIQQ